MRIPFLERELESGTTIAVVGNSPKLREHECGSAIDHCDIVMRFNNADTTDWIFTGSKTTFRYIGSNLSRAATETAIQVARAEESIVIFGDDTLYRHLYPKTDDAFRLIPNHHAFARSSFDWMSSVTGVTFSSDNGNPPRSGVVIIAYLLKFWPDKRLRLFGFETENRRDGPEHYFNDKKQISSFNNYASSIHCATEIEFFFLSCISKLGAVDVN